MRGDASAGASWTIEAEVRAGSSIGGLVGAATDRAASSRRAINEGQAPRHRDESSQTARIAERKKARREIIRRRGQPPSSTAICTPSPDALLRPISIAMTNGSRDRTIAGLSRSPGSRDQRSRCLSDLRARFRLGYRAIIRALPFSKARAQALLRSFITRIGAHKRPIKPCVFAHSEHVPDFRIRPSKTLETGRDPRGVRVRRR